MVKRSVGGIVYASDSQFQASQLIKEKWDQLNEEEGNVGAIGYPSLTQEDKDALIEIAARSSRLVEFLINES
jgi:hypothetical protein